MVDSIKITALQDIGANIAYTTLVPVVNMAGTPTTQKANLQNLGNLILNGAGGSYFARAAQANLALSVVNAAQSNITSVGTLTTLAVTGNITAGNINGGNIVVANFYYGDGRFLTNVVANGSYSNSNVANYLPTFTGTVGANRISSNTLSGSNVEINANGAVFMFGQGGALEFPAPPGILWAIEPNSESEFEIKSTSNVVISTDTSNINAHFTFDSEGIFTAPSNVNLLGSRLNVGPDAATAGNLLNPTLVIANTGAQYIQAAIINNDGAGSSDWSADGAGGSDDEAWTDMGFAGFSFNDANFTITEPGDGYLFVQAYANGLGGNMVLATGDHSNTADIIFATGGFLANNEFARIDHANDVFHLTRANSGIQFSDGSIQTTAGGGGSTGNVTFANVTVQGAGAQLFLSPDSTFTANLAYVRVRAGDVASHIHMDTGNNEAYDLILGDDSKFVQVSSTGNIIMSSYDGNTSYAMTLDTTGNLILAGGNSVISSIANSSLDPVNPNVSTMIFTPDPGYSSQSLVLDPTSPGHIHLRSPGTNIEEPLANIFLGGENSSFEVGYYNGSAPNVFVHSGGNTWTFDTTGNLTTPGNLVIGPGPGSGSSILQYDDVLQIVGEGANSAIIMGWAANQSAPDSIALIGMNTPFANGVSNVTIAVGNNATTVNYWNFDSTGNLTLPGNTVAINFANGSAALSNLVQWTTAPVANTSAGTAGQAAYDSGGNLYVCVTTNTWAKFSGTTSW
jgi:hypothetical protein